MSLSNFMTDTISLLKKNGEKINDIKASVQKKKIFIDRSDVLIETGDLIQWKMSNGGEETYKVINPGFYESHGQIPAHYQMDVKKLGLSEAKKAIQNAEIKVGLYADSLAKQSVPKKKTDEIYNSSNDRNNSMEWDVFICHASEDKEEFVRPLANSLLSRGLKVWFDEFTLTVGDSLRRSIDKGLANSRYGIVVISPNFFHKDWPQKELDGLATLERNGRKVILPVWHQIQKEVIEKYSPTLADLFATSSKKGVKQVVDDILEACEYICNRKFHTRVPQRHD